MRGINIGLDEIDIENVVLYKKARFVFKPGITYIVGKNLNRREPDASNYTGKSLLFSVVPNVLLTTPAVPIKNARSAQKDIFGKDTRISLKFHVGKKVYVATQTAKECKLSCNGKDTKIRTKDLFREKLGALLRTNEEEFFTLYYLNSSRPTTFKFGTAAARFAFITNMFRLQDLDEIKRWLTREYGGIKESLQLKERIRQEIDELGQIDSSELSRKKTRYKKLLKEQKSLVPQINVLSKQLTTIELIKASEPLRTKVRKLEQQCKSVDVDELNKELEKLEQKIDRHVKQQGQIERKRRLEKKLEANRYAKYGLKKLQQLYKKLEGKLDSLREIAEQKIPPLLNGTTKKNILLAREHDLSKLDEYKDKMQDCAARCRQATTDLKEFVRHFEHKDNSKCPTCQSSISRSAKSSMSRLLKRAAEEAKLRLAEQQQIVQCLHMLQAFNENRKVRRQVEEARARIDALEQKNDLEQLQQAIQLLRDYEDYKDVEDSTINVDALRDRQEGIRIKLAKVRDYRSAKKQLRDLEERIDLDGAKVEDEARTRKELKQLQVRSSELSDKLPSLRSSIDSLRSTQKTLDKLHSELEALGKHASKAVIYEALINAYSKNGIKMLLIQRIAKMIEANLNRYAKLMYPEPMTFAMNVGNNKFDALVTRKFKKRSITSDIRMLSGAEGGAFNLVFLLACLPLIPKNRRIDTLILDEPEVNMDPGMRTLLTQVILPELAKIIPKIVLITPHQSIVRTGDRVFTVVKTGDTSTLVKGLH